MTPKAKVLHPLPGHLYIVPRGNYSGRQQPISLRVACLCGRWHSHGAGTVGHQIERPGTITHRVTHCLTHDYTRIAIQAEPFRASWQTPRGRISSTYHRRASAA